MNELGLSAAIAEWLEVQIEKRHGLQIDFFDGLDENRKKNLEESMRAILFRNVRELLTNVVKHARAKKVSVHLNNDATQLKITIVDDGVGFDPDAANQMGNRADHFGLFSIQERMADLGGKLDIRSAPGKGCTAMLEVPLK